METVLPYQTFFERKIHQNTTDLKHLKYGVWLYFLLVIFEGALRKWFLPSLSTPLLVVRDPIALWVIVKAANHKIFKTNTYITSIVIISLLSLITTLTVGHGNVPVALFGVRILLIHFPFMFAMGSVFDRNDVEQLGKVTLWISLPMVVLIGIQFYSPQSAWVNRGVGGDEGGAGFAGALGYFRPPGTFSFTNGNALFFGFAGMFVFYFILNPQKIPFYLLLASIVATMASVPLSISRGLSFTLAFCFCFMLLAMLRKPQNAGKVLLGLAGVGLLFLIVSQFGFFQTASEAFVYRFTNANEAEGGLVEGVIGDRYFGGMLGAIANSSQIPFFGFGLGMGTNVGSQILTGKSTFLISEGEWGRLIGEMGLLLGLLIIIIRLSFCFEITVRAFRKLSQNDVLPWMTLSFALLAIPQGQWSQPTSLGFSTLAGGLVLAALNKK